MIFLQSAVAIRWFSIEFHLFSLKLYTLRESRRGTCRQVARKSSPKLFRATTKTLRNGVLIFPMSPQGAPNQVKSNQKEFTDRRYGNLNTTGAASGEFDVSRRLSGAAKSHPKAFPGNFERHDVLCPILHWFLFDLDRFWSVWCLENRVPVEAKRIFLGELMFCHMALLSIANWIRNLFVWTPEIHYNHWKTFKMWRLVGLVGQVGMVGEGVVYLCGAPNQVKSD